MAGKHLVFQTTTADIMRTINIHVGALRQAFPNR